MWGQFSETEKACAGACLTVLLRFDCPLRMNDPQRGSFSLLQAACESGWTEGVEILAAHGIDVNAALNACGQTALHVACRAHSGACVEMLLRLGANLMRIIARGAF